MCISTHKLARSLLGAVESPIRAVTVGRFTTMWDGRDGDFRRTVPTSEIFGRKSGGSR